MQFEKDKNKDILALIDYNSKINVMTLTQAIKLDFKVQKTDAGA